MNPFAGLDRPPALPRKQLKPSWGLYAMLAVAFIVVVAPLWGSWLFSGAKPALATSKKEYGRLLAFEYDNGTEDRYHWQTHEGEVVEKSILDLGEKMTGKRIGWIHLYSHLGKQGWKLVAVAVHPMRSGTFKEYIFERDN